MRFTIILFQPPPFPNEASLTSDSQFLKDSNFTLLLLYVKQTMKLRVAILFWLLLAYGSQAQEEGNKIGSNDKPLVSWLSGLLKPLRPFFFKKSQAFATDCRSEGLGKKIKCKFNSKFLKLDEGGSVEVTVKEGGRRIKCQHKNTRSKRAWYVLFFVISPC